MKNPNTEFLVSKGMASGRFKFMVYRTAPPNVFSFTSPTTPALGDGPGDGAGGGDYTCEGVPDGVTVIPETLMCCLYDQENAEQVDFVKTVALPQVRLHNVDVTLPLYKVQNDAKMMLWSVFNPASGSPGATPPLTVRRVLHVAFVLYPMITQDELECILRSVVPLVRPYYCFGSGAAASTAMEVTLFSLIPVDASLYPRLGVLGQLLDARFTVVCLAGEPCHACPTCTSLQAAVRARYFQEPLPLDQSLNFAKLVAKLENRLLCMGNIKGLIVSSKMQSIFNRMQYIEEKYRGLQHHLMTDTAYEGMLTDIEHIESRIKDVAVQIPLSYIEGNNLLHKIVTYRPPPAQASGADCGLRGAGAGAGAGHMHVPAQLLDDSSFFIPGRFGAS
jgi:hypothetical protein